MKEELFFFSSLLGREKGGENSRRKINPRDTNTPCEIIIPIMEMTWMGEGVGNRVEKKKKKECGGESITLVFPGKGRFLSSFLLLKGRR